MSNESMPQHNARVLEEERKVTTDNLAQQDAIRHAGAAVAATELKHEQKIEAKKLEHTHDDAKQNAKNLKEQTKANAEKLKI